MFCGKFYVFLSNEISLYQVRVLHVLYIVFGDISEVTIREHVCSNKLDKRKRDQTYLNIFRFHVRSICYSIVKCQMRILYQHLKKKLLSWKNDRW